MCTDLDVNYDLVFHDVTPSGYAMMTVPKKLDAVTACLWMKTTDIRNFGTPFSYAAESNWLDSFDSNIFTLTDYGDFKVQ